MQSSREDSRRREEGKGRKMKTCDVPEEQKLLQPRGRKCQRNVGMKEKLSLGTEALVNVAVLFSVQ